MESVCRIALLLRICQSWEEGRICQSLEPWNDLTSGSHRVLDLYNQQRATVIESTCYVTSCHVTAIHVQDALSPEQWDRQIWDSSDEILTHCLHILRAGNKGRKGIILDSVASPEKAVISWLDKNLAWTSSWHPMVLAMVTQYLVKYRAVTLRKTGWSLSGNIIVLHSGCNPKHTYLQERLIDFLGILQCLIVIK